MFVPPPSAVAPSQIIAAKETGSSAPVRMIDGSTFVFTRAGNMFLVAVTRSNANAALVFHFLNACVDIFKGYFSGKFDEETLRNNFSLVYELLDGERMAR
jgi:AP-2 complex subunit mu-1